MMRQANQAIEELRLDHALPRLKSDFRRQASGPVDTEEVLLAAEELFLTVKQRLEAATIVNLDAKVFRLLNYRNAEDLILMGRPRSFVCSHEQESGFRLVGL